jgi:hypothetical protein
MTQIASIKTQVLIIFPYSGYDIDAIKGKQRDRLF